MGLYLCVYFRRDNIIAMTTTRFALNRTTLWACSLGTLLEWYDFFIFAILAPTISTHFFPSQHQGTAFLLTLLAFATSFISRPIGGLIFGYIGDTFGRKPSLLGSLFLMGVSSTVLAIIPSYTLWGTASSVIVFIIRFLQGLALGGEYGGAATYVAEQATAERRATHTSYLQTTSSFGFIFALLVVVFFRFALGEQEFDLWGWRIPFLLSLLWIVPSYFIRKNLVETEFFKHIKRSKTLTSNPLKELFGNRTYLRALLVSVFGLTMGQAISSYAGFYSMYFIQGYNVFHKIDIDLVLIISTLLGIPSLTLAGRWADKTSYKFVILLGLLLCIVFYIPVFALLEMFITGHSPQSRMSFVTFWGIVAVLVVQKIFFSMVYAPLIAQLTVLFPTRLRYTGISLSYNIGTGIFGGTFLAVVNYVSIRPLLTNAFYDAMLYPMVMMTISLVVGFLYLPKEKNIQLQ